MRIRLPGDVIRERKCVEKPTEALCPQLLLRDSALFEEFPQAVVYAVIEEVGAFRKSVVPVRLQSLPKRGLFSPVEIEKRVVRV